PVCSCPQPRHIGYVSFFSVLCFFVVNEFTVPFDFNIFPLKVADDDAFMHVLGQTQHEGKTAEPFADITEIDLSPSAAIIKNRDAVSNDSLLNHLTGQTVLVIQFKCPCMDHHGPRFFTGAACLIYDPEWYAFAFHADSHRKSCRPCPHNQYFSLHTTAPLRVLLPCSRFRRLIFPAGLDHFPREIRHDGFDTESEKMFRTLTVVDRPDTDFIFDMV